jgi:hypothetical protein
MQNSPILHDIQEGVVNILHQTLIYKNIGHGALYFQLPSLEDSGSFVIESSPFLKSVKALMLLHFFVKIYFSNTFRGIHLQLIYDHLLTCRIDCKTTENI